MFKYQYLILLLFFVACKYSEKPKTFSNKEITLQYPSYLKENKDVFPVENLILGLKNDYRDVFYICVDYGMKPGDNGFNIMFDSLSNQLKNGIREAYVENDTAYTFNNFKTRCVHISGIVANEKQEKRMYFIFNLLETPEGRLYQTSGWCFRHKRELWLKDIEAITHSIKLN